MTDLHVELIAPSTATTRMPGTPRTPATRTAAAPGTATAPTPGTATAPTPGTAATHTPATPASPTPRPVLLIHGFASRAELNWKQSGWVRFFTRASRPLILVDLPGHGRSADLVPAPGSPHNPYLPSNIVRALALAATTAGVSSEHTMDVIGYSLGARLAFELIAAHPELVHRAVLGGAAADDHLATLNLEKLRGHQQPEAGSVEAALASMLNSAANSPADANANADANKDRMLALAEAAGQEPFRPFARNNNQTGPNQGSRPTTPIPPVPTLFISGAQDSLSDPQALASLSPQFEYRLIEGRDHVSVLTSHEFKAQALAFLDQD